MFVTHCQPNVTIPIAESTVLEMIDADPAGRLVMLQNLDLANTMSYKWQTSPDRTVWTDIAAIATLAPGATVAAMLTSVNNFHRLRAYGNLIASVAVLRNRTFSGTMPLITL